MLSAEQHLFMTLFKVHAMGKMQPKLSIPVTEELKHLHITGKQTPEHGVSVSLSLGA